MKKATALILLLCILFSLAGCRAPLATADLDAELDRFIHRCIMERYGDQHPQAETEYANESHDVLGTDASEGRITVYAWVLYRQWKEENGRATDVSGSDIPTAIMVEEQAGGTYKLIEYWEPRDGSYYSKDIQAKFPGKIRIVLDTVAQSQTRFNATQQDADMHFFGDELNDEEDDTDAEVLPAGA